jgi:acyl-CoA synthetase (NDP forming)
MGGLEALFAPRSVAILGVSRDPAKLGFRLLKNVRDGGFAGEVYPVNPAGEPILGLPTVPAAEALPEEIDLALVSLPAAAVPAAIKTLAARRTKTAVVLSSGFGEVDDDGRGAQAALLATAREAGLRLVGPNCMGVYSSPVALNATYFWDLPRRSGGIGVVSQSGAYGGLIFRHLGSRDLGVARFLSIGNQADVDVAEVIEYLVDDEATTLIACFIEDVRDGRRFVAAAERAVGRKPVVVLKGGGSDAGRRAAASHTGALAGPAAVFRAACLYARAVLTEETEEFFDAIEALALTGSTRPAAPSVAIITVSGGPSVIAADCAERAGLTIPSLDEVTRSRLRLLLPAFAAVGNPVDFTPQVERPRIAEAVRVVFDHPAIAGAVAIDVGLDLPEFADAIVAAARATSKPAVAFAADAPETAARLRASGVPVLPSPERAVRAWRALWRSQDRTYRRFVHGSSLPDDVATAVRGGSGPLAYGLARRVLEAYGVRFCREVVATSPEEAVRAAEAIGYPVVVKAEAAGLTHKTEAGGVALGLRDGAAVRAACHQLAARTRSERFLVQQQIGPGVELLLGGRRDEVFGPVVAVGAGGVLTEVVRATSFRLAPLAEEDIEDMLGEGALPRLLAGPRGLPPVDRAALAEAIHAVSDLLMTERRVVEVDINPIIAAGSGLIAVDALVIVGAGR